MTSHKKSMGSVPAVLAPPHGGTEQVLWPGDALITYAE
jgi:hypothetical protein